MHFRAISLLLFAIGIAGCIAFDLVSRRVARSTVDSEAEIEKNIAAGGWWSRRCCGNGSDYNPEFARKKHAVINLCTPETVSKSRREPSADPFVSTCEDLKEKNRRSVCNVECVYKRMGIVDGKGNIDVNKLKELSEEFATSSWLRQVRAKAIEKCSTTGDLDNEIESTEPKCNSRAYNLKHCLFKEVIIACPEEHQLKNEYCTGVRKEFIKN